MGCSTSAFPSVDGPEARSTIGSPTTTAKAGGPARRLVTSPFLNISTLVRGPAVLHGDGSLGLPVYHEFLGKFGEYLRIDGDGRVVDKARMSSGYSSLQPVVVPLAPERALGLLRQSGTSSPRVLTVESRDAGASWSEMTATPLANPDAAVAALRMSSGELLIAFNDSETDRSNLSLAISGDDGDSWELVHVLEPPGPSETRGDMSIRGSSNRRPATFIFYIRGTASASCT